jgi:hypothetical protein
LKIFAGSLAEKNRELSSTKARTWLWMIMGWKQNSMNLMGIGYFKITGVGKTTLDWF